MPKQVVPLTDPKCAAAKPRDKDYKLSDGQGLFLLVKSNGAKVWRMKYKRPDGREALATFGTYPATTLAAARERRRKALEWLAKGKDPIEEERREEVARSSTGAHTFEAVAREWHSAAKAKWSVDHAARIWRELEADLFPMLGKRNVSELKTRDLKAAVRAVEKRGALDVAGRLRQRIVGIMRTAVQDGIIDYNPALDLAGSTATATTRHRPALPLERLPELLQRIDADTGRTLTRLAVKLTLLVFIRSSELRFARWDEIDFDAKMWTIPADRQQIAGVKYSGRGSKMRTPHLVPLSTQAIQVLRQIQQISGRFELLFPGDHEHWKPMSENTVNKLLRRAGYDTKAEVCGHGFRTMACSALSESGLWSRDAVERQMSHLERNGVRAAYTHKAEHLQERKLMMAWWADYLDANRERYVPPYEFTGKRKTGGNVVEIRRA